MNLTTKGREAGDGYAEFVDKFKPKLTTDDCYTPPKVYDAVLGFVRTIADIESAEVVRPFFPGGDYQDLGQYPKGCVVVDNPPFSILSKIIRFYCRNGIRFFLFGPGLTLFTAADCDVTYIISDSNIEYENGAKVRTGFITNLVPDLRIWLCPELRDAIEDAQDGEDKTKRGFVYPDNIVTAATLQTIVKRGVELKIRKRSCRYVGNSESFKQMKRGAFGGCFILSDTAAAERAAATRLMMTKNELALIAWLNKQEKEEATR